MMDFEVISTYTKAQAVEDGQQVKVEDQPLLDALGIKGDVYITSTLWLSVDTDDEYTRVQNLAGLLGAASYSFRRGDPMDLMRTDILYVPGDGGVGIRVWGVIDGDGVTLMLPEDY